jgi:uncharacterized protein YutE (UPF0331/DUF86 family)
MPSEVIAKKLEQVKELLAELSRILDMPIEDFQKDLVAIRAAERNFQLVVELASDINAQILFEHGSKTPDTYKQSFLDLVNINVLQSDLARKLTVSAQLRNILVHEYDFDEDYERFYKSAKDFIPIYKEYSRQINDYISK